MRELDDGRVLLHCFAECPVEDVLAAAGLTFDALFPERAVDHRVKRSRLPFDARDVLHALSHEVLIVAIYASGLRNGRIASHDDHQRFLLAMSRITQAKEYCDGK